MGVRIRRPTKLFRQPFHYVRIVFKAFARLKHPFRSLWHYVLLDRPGYRFCFRNGMTVDTKYTADPQVVFAVLIHDIYSDVGSGKTIIDLGANIGCFTLSAAYGRDNTVYAYEPDPGNFEVLRRNVAENGLEEKVRLFKKGVSSKRGSFVMASELGPESRIYGEGEAPDPGQPTATVECVTLEDVFEECGLERCDLMKIDCEGSEYDILFSAPDSMFDRIPEFRLEAENLDEDRNREKMKAFLRSKGYEITPRGRVVFYAKRADSAPGGV